MLVGVLFLFLGGRAMKEDHKRNAGKLSIGSSTFVMGKRLNAREKVGEMGG